MNTGILIVAVGHGNYGKLAATLAMSIRGNGSKYPIHLVYTESTLKAIGEDYINFFDSKSECPSEYLFNNGEQCFIKVKSHINELTPFENTLFLDSDIIMINNGMLDTIIDEIKEAYGFTNEDIWNVHSEFIWWKKTEANNQLFNDWIYNFENLKVKSIEFGGCIPDELPLWIAMIQNKIVPHQELFHPTFWPMDASKQMRIADLRKEYCGVSIGGNNLSPLTKNNYDLLVSLFAKITNMRYKYFAQPKKKWLPERHTY